MSRQSSQVSQNVDNFISGRSSTRLHAPPGGGSSMGSLIFGGGDDQPAPRVSRRGQVRAPERQEDHNIPQQNHFIQQKPQQMQQQQQQPPVMNQVPQQQQQQSSNPITGGSATSSNSYARGSSQNTGNVLTDRRTTRVHAPPGGKSNFTLG